MQSDTQEKRIMWYAAVPALLGQCAALAVGGKFPGQNRNRRDTQRVAHGGKKIDRRVIGRGVKVRFAPDAEIVRLQHLARGAYRVLARQARAQEDGQQLRIGQDAGPVGQQLFAGAFGVGPMADVHAHRVGVRGVHGNKSSRTLRVS